LTNPLHRGDFSGIESMKVCGRARNALPDFVVIDFNRPTLICRNCYWLVRGTLQSTLFDPISMKRFPIYLIAFGAVLAHASVRAQVDKLPATASDNNLVVTAERVHKDGEAFYELQATGTVRATPQQTWKRLTAYDEMQAYVPNLSSAKLVSRNGQESTIEQRWVKRVLFFTHTVNLVVRANEYPVSRIDISLVSGEMKKYAATWEMTPIGPDGVNGTRISYHGKIEPDSYMPSLFGTSMMLSDVRKMMEAVLAEIDK
jgi:ribosome-associated toxin RatA of RatAB toxin-antitoxin module